VRSSDVRPAANESSVGTRMAEGPTSAVAWSAIFGGAVAALAATLVLMSLGTGLGLTTVSPWPNSNPSATTFGVVAAIWLVIVQWLSSALGGYLTGRLRTKWVGMHTDEVFFRDTAHGFLAWAVATVVVVIFVASAALSGVSGAAKAGTAVASSAAEGAGQGARQEAGNSSDPTAYLVDLLFRSDNPNVATQGGDIRSEATRILVAGVRNGDLPPPDRAYLGKLVASKTNLSQPEAEKRVDIVIAQMKDAAAKARQAADTARKTAVSISILTALSMVIGAFIASAAAALGGRLRDEF
jgi:hypothetical protein